MFRRGAKFTVPLSNTILPSASRLPVLAAFAAKVSLVEKFSPSSAATPALSTSVRMYQMALWVPASRPLYSGRVIVPFLASTVPEFNSCTGPTRLGLVVEGDGPKYDSGTLAPTDGGAGNKSQPGPGPMGPGPGPCAELRVEESASNEVAESSVVADLATGRAARWCTAIVAGESGALADCVASARASELSRLPKHRPLRARVIRTFARAYDRVVRPFASFPGINDLRIEAVMWPSSVIDA